MQKNLRLQHGNRIYQLSSFPIFKSRLFKLACTWESPGHLVNNADSDSGLRWSLKFYLSNRLPGDVDSARPGVSFKQQECRPLFSEDSCPHLGGNSLSDKHYFWNPVNILPTKAQASPTPCPLARAWTNHKLCPYPLDTGQISSNVQKQACGKDWRKKDGRARGREQGRGEGRRREERKGLRTEREVRKMSKAKDLLWSPL